MKKYEYKFVTVKTTGLWYDDYQEIIRNMRKRAGAMLIQLTNIES